MTDSKILCTGHEPFELALMKWIPRTCRSRPWIPRLVRPRYARESERLDSFSAGWLETAEARPRDLASSGFYFLGRQDICECFSCKLRLHNWRWGDAPSSVHRRQSPHCKMALGVDDQNVALGEDLESDEGSSGLAFTKQSLWEQALGVAGTEEEKRDLVTDHGVDSSLEDAQLSEVRAKKSHRQHKVKLEDRKEEFRTKAKRLSSFTDCWSKESIVPASELAKVGFYYGGTKDRVICAYCGQILLNFVPGDTAYGEHFKHSGKCPFLKCLSDPEAPRLPEMKDEEDLLPKDPEEYIDVSSDGPSIHEVMQFVEILGYSRDKIEAAVEELQLAGVKHITSVFLLDTINADVNSNPKKWKKKTKKVLEMETLKAENTRLKLKCYGCEKMANMLLLPCAHLVSCDKCCDQLMNCPRCGKKVLGSAKTYMV